MGENRCESTLLSKDDPSWPKPWLQSIQTVSSGNRFPDIPSPLFPPKVEASEGKEQHPYVRLYRVRNKRIPGPARPAGASRRARNRGADPGSGPTARPSVSAAGRERERVDPPGGGPGSSTLALDGLGQKWTGLESPGGWGLGEPLRLFLPSRQTLSLQPPPTHRHTRA